MNIKNFRINTDYPMDKVIFLKEVTITPDSSGTFDQAFAHGLGAIPFCKGVVTDDGWNTTYQSGFNELAESGQYAEKVFRVYSNETSVRVYGWLADVSQGQQVKPVTIRVWGVFNESATQNVDVPPTRNESTNSFIINSDFNYLSLFAEGMVDVPVGGERVFNHNLGYVPAVDVWVKENGWWNEMSSGDSFTNDSEIPSITNSVSVETNRVVFRRGNEWFGYSQYYYRIYL